MFTPKLEILPVNLKQIPVLKARSGVTREPAKMNPRDLQTVAIRVVWFKKPEDALQDTTLFLTHVMTYGTLSDITTTLHYFSESDFEAVLGDHLLGSLTDVHGHAWNLRYHREPVPPLPVRNFALSGSIRHRKSVRTY